MKIEDVDVRDIARQFGTPVYVYSLGALRESIAEIKTLAPVVRYAMKAESNKRILEEMKRNGIHIDAVSVLEVQRAMRAGFDAAEICFTSDVFFHASDAEYCIENNVYTNCGTLGMLREYGQTLKRLGRGSNNVSIRINPGEGSGHSKKTNTGGPYSKHGIWYQNLDEARAIAKEYGLRINGVHIHIGSGGDMDHLKRLTGKLVDFAKEFEDVEVINFGGGLPYQYHEDRPQADVSGYKPILEERVAVLARAQPHLRRVRKAARLRAGQRRLLPPAPADGVRLVPPHLVRRRQIGSRAGCDRGRAGVRVGRRADTERRGTRAEAPASAAAGRYHGDRRGGGLRVRHGFQLQHPAAGAGGADRRRPVHPGAPPPDPRRHHERRRRGVTLSAATRARAGLARGWGPVAVEPSHEPLEPPSGDARPSGP